MTDITTPLTELRAAYRAYQNAKRDKKEEITEKYRTRMEDEIRAAVQAEKYAFASLLKDRKEFYSLRVTDLQDHVLRTRNWKVWEDIRDFADIEPEQIVRENARELKRLENSHFRWSDDYATVTVVKNSKGDELEEPVIYTASTIRVKNELLNALPTSDRDELVAIKTDTYKGWMTQLHNELEAQIEAGNITAPEGENSNE